MRGLLAATALAFLALAGCGADGPPTAPIADVPEPVPPPGITLSGQVQVGVAGGS